MRKLVFIFLSINGITQAQLSFDQQNIELGPIAEAYEIKGDVILQNKSEKKIFLMRADAEAGVKVYTSKKTLIPGDTALLIISFIPETSGRFSKKIKLVATDKETPYQLTLSGTLQKVNANNKMACYYFGKGRTSPVTVKEEVIVAKEPEEPRDKTNKMPGSSTPQVTKQKPPVYSIEKKEKEPPLKIEKGDFSEAEYKPNNILFLVDVSSSMRDSLKLPLMKTALHKLIETVRNIDTITFVTYASKVKVLQEAVSGLDKKTLHVSVDSLKAKGMTSGKTAILVSQQLAQKHFIQNGNNQIIIATDGEFKFTHEDYKLWKERQGNKKIVLSTVAFGSDKLALKNLKEIARKGDGSFIHIENKDGSEGKLLEEIKFRSRIEIKSR
jgi:Mg-chelatase subunit ChlD